MYMTLRTLYRQFLEVQDKNEWLKWVTDFVSTEKTGLGTRAACLLVLMVVEHEQPDRVPSLVEKFKQNGQMPQDLICAHVPGVTWTEAIWYLTLEKPSTSCLSNQQNQPLLLSCLPGFGINQPIYDLAPHRNIYIYKHYEGYWVLLAIIDMNVPFLANEKNADNKIPFYYTAGVSFQSPVAWLQKTADEFRSVVDKSHFIQSPIRMQLYLPNPKARIVNLEEMKNGQWADLDLQVVDRTNVRDHIRAVLVQNLPLYPEWQQIISDVRNRIS